MGSTVENIHKKKETGEKLWWEFLSFGINVIDQTLDCAHIFAGPKLSRISCHNGSFSV